MEVIHWLFCNVLKSHLKFFKGLQVNITKKVERLIIVVVILFFWKCILYKVFFYEPSTQNRVEGASRNVCYLQYTYIIVRIVFEVEILYLLF